MNGNEEDDVDGKSDSIDGDDKHLDYEDAKSEESRHSRLSRHYKMSREQTLDFTKKKTITVSGTDSAEK